MKDKNTEIREAIDAGNRALSALEEAAQHLQAARGLGLWDMLGGGFNLCGDIANWTEIPADYKEKGQAGVDEEMKNFSDEIGHTNEECIRYRDKMLIEILKLHHKF